MDNWFRYDWEVRGAPAVFEVDLTYQEDAPAGAETLLWLSCAAPQEGAAFSGAQYRRAQGMHNKIQRVLRDAVYVGCIQLDGCIQYYFYAAEETLLEELDALCEKERKLAMTCGRAHEPGWQTYRKLLCPDAAKFQTAENARSIEMLHRAGDGLVAARRIRLYVFFPTEPCRLLFQEQARLNGFAVGEPIYRPEQEQAYGVALQCISTLEKRAVDAITTRIIREAAHQGGVLMGWDCTIVPKKHPLG